MLVNTRSGMLEKREKDPLTRDRSSKFFPFCFLQFRTETTLSNHSHLYLWQTWNANIPVSAGWIVCSVKALESGPTNPRILSNVRKGCLSTQAAALTSFVCISLIQIQTGATWAGLSVSAGADVGMKEIAFAIELPLQQESTFFKWHG